MNFKFPSSYRIRQRKEFEQAFKNKALTNKWFTIYSVNNNHEYARLGMIVSKRTMAKSVSRNYAKRLIRETFRLKANDLPAVDFFVRIRKNLTVALASEAKEALLNLLTGAKQL